MYLKYPNNSKLFFLKQIQLPEFLYKQGIFKDKNKLMS